LTEMGLATFRNHSGPARWDRNAATTIPDPYRPTIKPQTSPKPPWARDKPAETVAKTAAAVGRM
jgi:hypothetical protein